MIMCAIIVNKNNLFKINTQYITADLLTWMLYIYKNYDGEINTPSASIIFDNIHEETINTNSNKSDHSNHSNNLDDLKQFELPVFIESEQFEKYTGETKLDPDIQKNIIDNISFYCKLIDMMNLLKDKRIIYIHLYDYLLRNSQIFREVTNLKDTCVNTLISMEKILFKPDEVKYYLSEINKVPIQ